MRARAIFRGQERASLPRKRKREAPLEDSQDECLRGEGGFYVSGGGRERSVEDECVGQREIFRGKKRQACQGDVNAAPPLRMAGNDFQHCCYRVLTEALRFFLDSFSQRIQRVRQNPLIDAIFEAVANRLEAIVFSLQLGPKKTGRIAKRQSFLPKMF